MLLLLHGKGRMIYIVGRVILIMGCSEVDLLPFHCGGGGMGRSAASADEFFLLLSPDSCEESAPPRE